MAKSLKEYLADPQEQVAFIADLTHRNPSTDAVVTQRISDRKILDSDYLRGLLVNPGGRSVSVEGDELSGIAEPTLEPMVFSNDPPTVGGAGPLDFLRDKSLAGRSVKLYGGDPDFPPPGTPWWTHLEHDGTNDSSSVGDFCDAGSSSFFFAVRVRLPSTQSGASTVAAKRSSGAGYLVGLSASGLPETFISDGTNTAAANATSGASWRDDEEHILVLVRDTSAGVLRLYGDGSLLASVSASSVGSLNNAESLVFGARSDLAFWTELHLIEAAWGLRAPTATEVSAWAARPFDEVSDDCVLWRVNDGSGSTVAAAASAQALTDSGAGTLTDLDAAIAGATWGEATEGEFPWGQLGSGVADGEPEFNDTENLMTLRIKSALDRLNQDLDVKSYVGEPGALKILTSTGKADAADNAAHHLTEFTVAGRFRLDTVGAATADITKRQTGTTANNWRVAIEASGAAIPGIMIVTSSSGGVGGQIRFDSTERYDDDEDHWFVFARSDSHAYLMVDGGIIGEEDNPSTPDTPTAGVSMGAGFHGGPGHVFDQRIIDHYVSPDEMRAAMATRASGDEEGLVGLWRGDNAVGSTLTDYSSTGANATISGTENTDFEWVSSDLGEPETAGRSMPWLPGSVFHAPADIVSSTFERWRANDREYEKTASGSWGKQEVRDEGELLTGGGTDYTWSGTGTVIALVAEAGEPLTVARAYGTLQTNNRLAALIEQVALDSWGPGGAGSALTGRGPITPGSTDSFGTKWARELSSLYHEEFPAGLWTRRRPAGDVLREILRGTLCYATLDREGEFLVSTLTPPMSPGPRGGSCLEFRGQRVSNSERGATVEWDSSAKGPSGVDFTLAAWVKTAWLEDLGGEPSIIDTSPAQATGSGGSDGVALHLRDWQGARQLRLAIGSGKTSEISAILRNLDTSSDWHFLAASHDNAGNATKFYAAPLGGTLALIGERTGFSLAGPLGDHGVIVGGNAEWWGAVAEPRIWNTVRSLNELQGEMDAALTGSETDLAFYAPLDGASDASLTDTVNSVVGVANEFVHERPDLEVDLTKTPRSFNRRNTSPAGSIEARYSRNYEELSSEQISALVSRSERIELQEPHRSHAWRSAEVQGDYLDARDLVLDTPFDSQEGGRAALNLARIRFSPGREIAILGKDQENPLRKGLLLEIGDEVLIRGYQDLVDGVSYRLIRVTSDLGSLDCELALWR